MSSPDGACGWCGETGQRWKMHPGGVLHHNRRDDGLIVPIDMCYSCCLRELTGPIHERLPEAESRFHPTDISFRRDRGNDVGHDGRPMSERELNLYIGCETIPRGSEIKDVSFIIDDDTALIGKKIIRPEG